MSKPPTIRPLSLRHKVPNYRQGFWLKLSRDTIKQSGKGISKLKPSLFKGRFSFKLRWEHIVIAFLLGALLLRGGSPHIVRSTYAGVSPAPTLSIIKPLPLIKDLAYKPQNVLEIVYVNKLRPAGTYGGADYAGGWCTFGVAQRLPVPPGWGNASSWPSSAMMAGYTVSGVPKEGSAGVSFTDGYMGHVVVVESVNPDGSFLIWEMNGAGGLWSTDERTATTAEFQSFIYF